MAGLAQDDLKRMRDALFFEGVERNRRLSRFWLLLPLSAVIAAAGVVSDSTATVIGAMIVAPLMTPILGIVLAVVLTDAKNLRRSILLVVVGAAVVVGLAWIMGLFVPYPVVAATNTQVAARVTPGSSTSWRPSQPAPSARLPSPDRTSPTRSPAWR